MKILESQSAQLTNYEVHKYLISLRDTTNDRKGQRPQNLNVVVNEVDR